MLVHMPYMDGMGLDIVKNTSNGNKDMLVTMSVQT